MAIVDFYYPFDSVDGDRTITAATERRFWGELFTDGVVGAGGFAISTVSPGVYNIGPGVAIMGGIVGGTTKPHQVTVSGTAGSTHYIVIRGNTYPAIRSVEIRETTIPQFSTADQLEQAGVRDVILYQIDIDANGNQGILDQRTYCTSFDAKQWEERSAEAVAGIEADGAAAVEALSSHFSAAVEAVNAETAGLYGAAGRQGFINPQFLVNQRGRSSYGLTSGTAYTFDRWQARVGGTALSSAALFSVEQDGQRRALKIAAQPFASTGTVGAACIAQNIEGGVRTFCAGGKSFTVSFDAKASEACKLAVEPVQFLASGDNGVTIAAQTVNLTTSWQRFAVTFKGTATPSAAQVADVLKVAFFFAWKGSEARFGSDQGAVRTFWLANMQINEGTQALACYAKPYADELEACQRYFVALGMVSLATGAALASSNQVITSPLPITRRLYRVPTVASTDRADVANKASAEVATGGWRNGLAWVLSGNSEDAPVFVVTNTDASAVTRVCFNSLALDAEIND